MPQIEEILDDGTTRLLTAKSPSYTNAQKAAQPVVDLIGSAIPVGLFRQVLPAIAFPYNQVAAMGTYAVNNVVGDVLGPLVHKRDPFAGVRAKGGGSVAKGLLKEHINTIFPLAAVGMIAYFSATYGTQFMVDHPSRLNYILSEEAYSTPILGTAGWALFRGFKALGMKMWDCPIHPVPEIEDGREPLLIQKAGQYVLRLFGDVSMTETVLFYLSFAGQQALAQDYRLQLGIFAASDAFLRSIQYLSYTHKPLASLVSKKKPAIEHDTEAQGYVLMPSVEVSSTDKAKAVGKRIAVWTAIFGTAYALNELACWWAQDHKPELCEESDLANRLTRVAAVVGVPMLTDFVIEQAIPAVKSLSCCAAGLFSRKSPKNFPTSSERVALLSDPSPSDTDYDDPEGKEEMNGPKPS